MGGRAGELGRLVAHNLLCVVHGALNLRVVPEVARAVLQVFVPLSSLSGSDNVSGCEAENN